MTNLRKFVVHKNVALPQYCFPLTTLVSILLACAIMPTC